MKLDWELFRLLFGAWAIHFEKLFKETDVMETIYAKLKKDGMPVAKGGKGKIICPDGLNTYRAFESCPPLGLNIIWILLDPYPSISKEGIKRANGIAMDCENTGILQPSLEKFYEGIEQEYGFDVNMIKPASLGYLYTQGNMFLNTALTVEHQKTGSHTELWEPFMKYFYEEIMTLFTGIIYVLCGDESQKLKKFINPLGNYIFEIEHPSFAARQYRDWNTQGIFKKINYILKNNNNMEIVWQMTEAPWE